LSSPPGYTASASASSGGSLTVQATLQPLVVTGSVSSLASVHVALGWSTNVLGKSPLIGRYINAVISFGPNSLTISVQRTTGLVVGTGKDGNGNDFSKTSTASINSLVGGTFAIDESDNCSAVVPQGTVATMTINSVGEALLAWLDTVSPERLFTGESQFSGTLELWASKTQVPPGTAVNTP
jgi:hypothetical protein